MSNSVRQATSLTKPLLFACSTAAALDWVAEHAVKPAVVSLSLGVPAGAWSRPMEDSIQHITEVLGIPVVVAAGNSAKDSCQVAPGRVVTAITVAASNLPTKFSATRAGDAENLYSWSNTGACVKLFAPGVDIYGACGGKSRCAVLNDSSYSWASGTRCVCVCRVLARWMRMRV